MFRKIKNALISVSDKSKLSSLLKVLKKYNIEMPIANSVYGILFENKNPLEAVKELMTRDLTAEKR